MKQDGTYREYGCIEQRLSQIGAKIANATDLSRKAKELASRSESTLISAQKKLKPSIFRWGAMARRKHRNQTPTCKRDNNSFVS